MGRRPRCPTPPRPRRHGASGGGRVAGLSAARVRANLERIRAAIGPGVEVVAAVKYLPADDLPALAEAGVTVVGENRAQDLIAKSAAHPGFRWHFIGQLQS